MMRENKAMAQSDRKIPTSAFINCILTKDKGKSSVNILMYKARAVYVFLYT